MSNSVVFHGWSGVAYEYFIMEQGIDTPMVTSAGNYAFAVRLATGALYPVYFGVADNLNGRVSRSHERWAEAIRLGAYMVLAHTTPGGERARLAEERDLIARYNPRLNVQHRTLG